MNKKVLRVLAGFLFSSTIGLLAYRKNSLSRGGVVGAIITGTTIFGAGRLSWALSTVFFFVSSSLLSHLCADEKAATATDKFSKGSQRDLGQVMANGGVATGIALAYALRTTRIWREALQAAFLGSVATATGDTWATELGVFSSQSPRLITTGAPTAPGTSGGVTLLGTAAAAAGALSLGIVCWLWNLRQWTIPIIALVSGLGGSFCDSVLGATVQAMYYCPTCNEETERRVHSCGTQTRALRGIPWIDNDVVNFLATLWGAVVAIAIQRLFSRIVRHDV